MPGADLLSGPFRTSRTALPDLDELRSERPGKSLWQSLLDYLDLPGLTVRSLLSGDFGGAARTVGSFALPGIIDQPTNRHDFGFLGNLVTDPLIWFTGGGAGLRGALAKAMEGVVGRAATEATAGALRRSLTKAGLSEFETLAKGTLGRTAARAGEAAFLKAARRLQRAPEMVEDLLGCGLADKGGLKFGLPFMEGKTIAFAGKPANLAMASPFYWVGKSAAKAIGATRAGQKVHEFGIDLMKKLYPGYRMTETGQALAANRGATIRRLQGDYADEIVKTFKGFDPSALEDFHQTLTGHDLRASGVTDAASFAQVHPKLDYGAALGNYKGFMDRMKADLVERGIWQPEIPEAVVQKRLAHLYPDEAQALAKFNKGGGTAKLGEDIEIPVWKRDVLHSVKSHEEARAWARAFKKANPDITVAVRRRRGAGIQPWEVTTRGAQEEMVNLSTLKLPENAAYAPQQLSEEALRRVERLNYEAMLKNEGDVFGIRSGAGTVKSQSAFTNERKFAQEDFLDFGESLTGPKGKPYQNQDIAELAMTRASAHARDIANFDMMKQARRVFGNERTIGVFDDEVKALDALEEARAAGKTNARIEQRGETWRVSEPGKLSAAEARDAAIRDRAFGEWIDKGAGALKKREGVMAAVDFVNRKFFKPLVTVGVGPIPNPAFHIRNILAGIWMAAAHPHVGLASGLKHTAQIFWDGVASAVEKVPGIGKLPRSQLTRILQGGATDAAVAGTHYTEKEIAELLKTQGVTRASFVRSEDLYDALAPVRKARSSGAALGKKVYASVLGTRFPSMVSDAIESRMRAQGFVHALRKGLSPQDAAKATRDAFIDYEMVSGLHRNIRDLIPFAQFTIGQTPRTILERPRVLSPLVASSRRGDTGIVPPWVQEQPHFRLGKDVQGKAAYLAGLGTPFEDINAFWAGSLGRTLEKAIGQTTPPVKAVYEGASERDPFFGRAIQDYKRETPVSSLLPDVLAGRKVRTTKTGQQIPEVSPNLNYVLQHLPWSRQISMANVLFDARKATWHKAISLLTGARVVSVDEDAELRKLILAYLKRKAEEGDVGEFSRFFAYGETSPQLAGVIKSFYGKARG